MEVKAVGRRTQLLDDLRKRRWCLELKEITEDKISENYSLSHAPKYTSYLSQVHGPADKQHT